MATFYQSFVQWNTIVITSVGLWGAVQWSSIDQRPSWPSEETEPLIGRPGLVVAPDWLVVSDWGWPQYWPGPGSRGVSASLSPCQLSSVPTIWARPSHLWKQNIRRDSLTGDQHHLWRLPWQHQEWENYNTETKDLLGTKTTKLPVV